MPIRVTVVNDYFVVVAGVNAFLAPYSDRIEMVETELVSSGSAAVDVALYDSFASSLGKDDRLETLLKDPTIGAVAVYSFTSDPRRGPRQPRRGRPRVPVQVPDRSRAGQRHRADRRRRARHPHGNGPAVHGSRQVARQGGRPLTP